MSNQIKPTESKCKTISAHKKIKHLTKKYRRFRYLKDKRKKIDLNQFFSKLNRKETKELNFNNFFLKLNELNRKEEDAYFENDEEDEFNSPNSSFTTINDFKIVQNNVLITNEDSENHLLELIKASSTITSNKVQRNQLDNCSQQLFTTGNKKETKKSSAAKHRERTINLLNEFNRYDKNLSFKEDRIVDEDILIDYFLNKIKDCLSKEEQLVFLKCLEEFDLVHLKLIDSKNLASLSSSTSSTAQQQQKDLSDKLKSVYSRIKDLINDCPNNELNEEFLLFMNYEIVKELNKQFDFNYWIKIKNFVQKIVIYLNQDCNSLMRLIKLLKQLKQNELDLDKKRIKNVLSKFLNSQPYLLNELNSLFLEEAPQDYLFNFNEDFDEIDLEEEINLNQSNDEHLYETIKIDLEDKEKLYSTRDCPCKFCHLNHELKTDLDNSILDNQFKHCISCSLKYIKNKVYCCQENQKLHFTSIEYIDKPNEELNQIN